MRKILIYQETDEWMNYYRNIFDMFENHEVETCKTSDEVLAHLKNPKHAPAMGVFSAENKSEFIKIKQQMDANSNHFPVVMTCRAEQFDRIRETLKIGPLLQVFTHDEDINNLKNAAKRMFNIQNRSQVSASYSQIHTNAFDNLDTVVCDIFVKLGDDHYVKFLAKNGPVEFDTLQKYKAKCDYFYVKEADYPKLNAQLKKSIDEVFESIVDNGGKNLMPGAFMEKVSMELQESVQDTINHLGLNETAVELTCKAMDTTLELIEKGSNSMEILKRNLSGRNYRSEMSFAISFIGCPVLKETPWNSDGACTALCLAAFFHDIALDDDKLAKVRRLSGPDWDELSEDEQFQINGHRKEAAEMLEQIDGIPSDVKKLILDHHEMPDGSGFPQGIDFKLLSPLSGVFILAHDLAHYMVVGNVDEDIVADIITEYREKYYKGNFKYIVDAMDKLFGKSVVKKSA